MLLTSNDLISMASKYAALSSNQAGLTSTDFLALGDLVITLLTSELLAAREEFLIYQESVAVSAGTASIRVPYRAINGDIRHLWWEDGTGSRKRLFGRTIESVEDYTSFSSSTSPDSFYVMGNFIVLTPTPSAAGSLVFAYPFRPNSLVIDSATQAISTVSTSSVTVANIPSNFVSGASYDIVDHKSGSGIAYFDLVGTISGNTITFDSPIPFAAVGNVLSLAGETSVVMLPEEGHGLLLESVIARIETIRGNAQRIKNSLTIIADARKAWATLLMNRVISKPPSAGTGGAQFPARPTR